ncbi:MAG: nucleotidyltransferase family protein [Candidatus Methanoperedens sp.]|nr:nucleotidyltransferase family protein [Candidatus Methanoperedens sp.]
MITRKEIIAILRRELPHLKTIFGVKRIGIFGSYSKEAQKEDSDVDLIVEFERPIGLKFFELSEYIENLLGKKVDILTPAGINSIRVKEVAENIKKSIVYV